MRTRVLITAAGMGKRFGALTRRTNKCLLTVAGQPLLRGILANFHSAHCGPIYLVTGYQARQVESSVKALVKPIYNPFFAVSGILGSFWAARNALAGHPFIFTTSDHFFSKPLIRACLRKTHGMRIIVQKKKIYTKEDAKVIIRGSRVVQMGKHLPPHHADGEFGGMTYFSGKASALFFKELRLHFENEGLEGYMMDLLMKIHHKYKLPVLYSLCAEDSRIEIDSVHDLIAARRMAARLK
ncbi:MAG: NTP transferase domain-containing protein [Candidatus Omnitrophota bacterium]